MFGIGFLEIVVLAIVCLIVYGPEQLPSLMRKLAIYYRQFLNLKEELSFQVFNIDEPPAKKLEKSVIDALEDRRG